MNHTRCVSEVRFRVASEQQSRIGRVWSIYAAIFLAGASCGVAADAASPTAGKSSDSAANPPTIASSAAVVKTSTSDSKPGATDVGRLSGGSAEEVQAALGKPTGKLRTAQGALWLYPQWRVQFDSQDRVLGVEPDQPVRLTKLDPKFLAAADAVEKASATRAAADAATVRARVATLQGEKIRVLSNGGEELNLLSLLSPDKITIVDFYADWCGPCRQIAPRLEQLVKAEPDVVLLKIDIVNWGTPVTRQFAIQSVPNVRVFGRTRTQIGEATHDLNQVLQRVKQAMGP